MKQIYQTQKRENNYPIYQNYWDRPRFSGTFTHYTPYHNCLSEKNFSEMSQSNQPPSISSLSEEENYNLNLNKPKMRMNYLEYKIDKLTSALSELKNSNSILKEDIYKYSDINKYLESEIKLQNDHNKDLLNLNTKLIEDNNELNNRLIDETNKFNELIKENEQKQKDYDDRQKLLELKDSKIANDYDELININTKTKNDYNILNQNYEELNKKNLELKNQLHFLKEMQTEQFSDIENKIDSIIAEIETLKNEQNFLLKENNENKNKIDLIIQEKENYCNLYNEEILLNESLTKELYDNKINLENLKKKFCENLGHKAKSCKKKLKSLRTRKKDLINELQKKITDYKFKSVRSSYNDEY